MSSPDGGAVRCRGVCHALVLMLAMGVASGTAQAATLKPQRPRDGAADVPRAAATRPMLFAVPTVPTPEDSLTGGRQRQRAPTALEHAATLRSPLGRLIISSEFGSRLHPVKKRRDFHYGVDYVAAAGVPVRAAQDGTVRQLGRRHVYGNRLLLDHGHGVQTVYGHLLKFMPGLKQGAVVRRGDIIGFVGATGRTTGPHLHFEVLADGTRVDPQRLTMALTSDRWLSARN